MKGKQSTVVIIVVVVAVLIVIGLLYRRSAERQRKAEEDKQATEQARLAREAQAKRERMEAGKVPEAPAVPAPEEAAPSEPTEPAKPLPFEPVPIEPAVEVPMPPPISDAKCTPDSPAMVKKRQAAVPEGMVYVSSGVFIMGSSPDAGYTDETPAHRVCLSGFYIDKYEVTNAQFKKFVDATGYVTDAEKDVASQGGRTWRHPYGPESNADDMPNYPVLCVSWNDANAYANWAGKRLPTEAEWEKAARGTDGRIYPWGNAEPNAASANIADKSTGLKWSNASLDDKHKTAAPVGSFPGGKSAYGAEDMAGNVWEWCLDWWDSDFYKNSPSQNPTGPQAGEFKVIRGGSWFYNAAGAKAARRMYFRPTGSSAAIGFRCVKDVG